MKTAAAQFRDRPAANRRQDLYDIAVLEQLRKGEVVVGCILGGPYAQLGNAGLTSLLSFTSDMQRLAEDSAEELAYGARPPSTDVRVLFAVAWVAFERSADA